MRTLVLVMLLAGALGGLVNFFLTPTSDAAARNIWKSLTVGVGAAFLVPLFLNMISSGLVDQIDGQGKATPASGKILVFAGFCLVAAISSSAFIKTLSDRILSEAKEARKEAKKAQETASQVQAAVNPLLEKQTEIDEVHGRSAAGAADVAQLDVEDLKILTALATSVFTLRSLKGIATETGQAPELVKEKLSKLVARGLASQRDSPNGERWYITQDGLAMWHAAVKAPSVQAT